MFEARLKPVSLAYPSSVSSYLADSFPPRGKLEGPVTRGLGERLLSWKPSPVGGKVAEPQVLTNEGLGDLLF